MKAEILIDREALRQMVREVLAEEGTPHAAPPASELFDEETRRAVQEQTLLAHKTYLSRKEAAKYLGVSERSISEWVARPAGQNPFPEQRAGGEPRYKRTDIDEWAEREARRQRLKLAG
jgi:excisionase family DNA binding protein